MADEPSAKTYRQLMREFRTQQLAATKENLQRLLGTFDRATQSILDRVKRMPEPETDAGRARYEFFLNLLREIDTIMERLRGDYRDLLDGGMVDLAQQAADRQAEIAKLVGAAKDPNLFPDLSHTAVLSDGAEVTVRFGRLAVGAVERLANKVYGDGLHLSQRLYNLDVDARRAIGDTLVQGLSEQIGAHELAMRLRSRIRDGMRFAETATERERQVNVRNRALTIARTEINNAWREASVQSSIDPATGKLKEYISAIGWRLSAGHEITDECDMYAADDTGLGEGNYLPGDVPFSHPRCRCYTADLLVALPDEQFVTMAPNAADVPESEVRRLAEKEDDPIARRWLDKYGSAESEE